MDTGDFEAKIAALRMAFRARAANDAMELEKLVQGVPASEELKRIRHLAHRLVGGAATFGLSDLTAPALLLEDEVIDGGPNVTILTTALVAEIRKCVAKSNTDKA